MKKLFSRTNCFFLALAILAQSIGYQAVGQNSVKYWPDNTPKTDNSMSTTTTVLLITSGVLITTAAIILIVVASKKHKLKKKMATSFNVPNQGNIFLYDKYSIPENKLNNESVLPLLKNPVNHPFSIADGFNFCMATNSTPVSYHKIFKNDLQILPPNRAVSYKVNLVHPF